MSKICSAVDCARLCYAHDLCRYHYDQARDRPYDPKYYRNTSTELVMFKSAKARAKKKNVPFTISVEDIEIPTMCPYLGLTLVRKIGYGAAPNSPSLDRIEPHLGYIPGNIQVISNLANSMKNSASLTELRTFAYNVLRRHPTGGDDNALEEGNSERSL